MIEIEGIVFKKGIKVNNATLQRNRLSEYGNKIMYGKAFCNLESILQKWEGLLHDLIQRKEVGTREINQLQGEGILPCFRMSH